MVEAAGDGVPQSQPGQRVWVAGSVSGTYAELALCEAWRVHPLPENVTFEQGAALGVPYSTAYRALFQRGRAKAAETVLVHGATGGVGVAAVQFAKAGGVRALATGGSEAGRTMLARIRVDATFDHSATDYSDEIREATGGKGVDVVIEMLANVNLARDLSLLGRGGRVVMIGNRGSIEINLRDLMHPRRGCARGHAFGYAADGTRRVSRGNRRRLGERRRSPDHRNRFRPRRCGRSASGGDGQEPPGKGDPPRRAYELIKKIRPAIGGNRTCDRVVQWGNADLTEMRVAIKTYLQNPEKKCCVPLAVRLNPHRAERHSVANTITHTTKHMNTRNTTIAAFAAACLAGSAAYAGPTKPAKKIVEPTPESCITGDIGIDVVSNYISKGVVLQNQGLILQPYADLHFRIYKGAGALTSVTADLGVWNSFQANRVPATPRVAQTTRNWFEFDFQTGLTFNFDKLSLGGYFKTYESPASAFPNTYTVGINVAYDDSAALGAFALHPYALVELELEKSTGNSVNGSRGQYYEIGIAPGHTWGALTMSLPLKAGFGSGGFYRGNRGFGFISVGARADYALNFVPACLGKWSVNAGASYYRLGGSNSQVRGALPGVGFSGASGNSPSGAQAVVDKNQLVFQGGLKVAF